MMAPGGLLMVLVDVDRVFSNTIGKLPCRKLIEIIADFGVGMMLAYL